MSVEVSIKDGVKLFDNHQHEKESLDIIHRLIAVGANDAVMNKYIKENQDLIAEFASASLNTILPIWPDLNEQVKLRVVSLHEEEFYQWVKDGSNG